MGLPLPWRGSAVCFVRGLSTGVAALPWLLGPGGVFLQLERKLVGCCCIPLLKRAVGSSSPLGFLRFWCPPVPALPSEQISFTAGNA